MLVRILEDRHRLQDVIAATVGFPVRMLRWVDDGDGQRAADHGLGLHLPDRDWPPLDRASGGLRSASCHDRQRVQDAAAAGFDFVTLAPIFAPGSKPGDRRPTLGLAGLSAAVGPLPVVALGGLSVQAASGMRDAGAAGVASITAFFGPDGVRAHNAAAIVAVMQGGR